MDTTATAPAKRHFRIKAKKPSYPLVEVLFKALRCLFVAFLYVHAISTQLYGNLQTWPTQQSH